MKCPYCDKKLIRGFLMSSRDITFATDNPDCQYCEAYHCISCKKIMIDYGNK